MSYKLNENFELYFEEYMELLLENTETSWEISHRKLILKEWLDNEIEQWENTQLVKRR